MAPSNYAATLDTLNDIGEYWAAQFEHKPKLPLTFSEDEAGVLKINGKPVCPISIVDPDRIFVDVEHFGFCTLSGFQCIFWINWPFDGPPRVVLN